MSVSATMNSVVFSLPNLGEAYGDELSNYLVAISTSCLQKTGGSFTLSAAADFGANFGLKSIYYKSRGTTSSTGVVRLDRTDTMAWRNTANNGDLALSVNTSDRLLFNSATVATLSYLTIADNVFTLTDQADTTKVAVFEVAGITSGNTRTFTFPDASTTLVGHNNTQTLTNKTLSGNTAATLISGSGTLTLNTSGTVTLPNATDTLVGKATTDTLTNKTLTSPTLVTPTLGVATATSINKMAITAPATSSTLAVADGKTLTASNTLTMTATDGSTAAFGAGGTVAYQGSTLAQFAATTSSQLAGVISDETGSGALVFATSPTLVTPVLGTPSSGTLTSCTGLPIVGGTTGTLSIARGGTGQTVANDALNALLPTQTSNANKALVTDGTNTSWVSALTTSLTSANIFVGNSSNVATSTAMSGDVTISNTGVTAIGSGKVTSTMILDGTILNADINASAAIDYSKLNLAASIVNTDVANGAAIAYTKLNLSNQVVNADIATTAAIAYSKLNLATSIVNADIGTSAAIAYSKLNLSASIVNGDISSSAAISGSKLQAAASGVQGVVSTGTQTLDGLKVFSTGIQLPTSGGTAATLSYYETGSTSSITFTTNGSSASSNTITATWTRIGDVVTIDWPAFSATMNGSSDTQLTSGAGVLPAAIRPSVNTYFLFPGLNGGGGVSTPGAMKILTTGTVQAWRDATFAAAYTAGGGGSNVPFTTTYKI